MDKKDEIKVTPVEDGATAHEIFYRALNHA